MYVLRPIKEQDIPDVETFAKTVSLGVFNLPKKVPRMHQMIQHSLESFAKEISQPGNELYFFILEDLRTGKPGGCCGIYAKTGVSHPLYFYRLETVTINTSPSYLPISRQFQLLNPSSELEGPSELCALYISPNLRHEGLGYLLSLSRFLFIASHPQRFTENIVAELRGVINKNGNAPFWDGLGKYFLNISFPELQAILEDDKHFAAEILPRYPIYVELLPKEVKEVIRKTHTNTRPALEMLLREGFKLTNHVDMFDGGPTVLAKQGEIRSIQKQQVGVIKEILPAIELEETTHLISNMSRHFRACYGGVTVAEEGVAIRADVAKALQVEKGNTIRYLARS